MSRLRGFASDNNSGVHPDVMRALQNVNVGHAVGYGDDDITQRTILKFKEIFGTETDVFFAYNGTGANVMAIQALAKPYHAVICPETAHINVDECGAPEKHAGCKLLPVKTDDGKLTVEGIKAYMHGIDFEHHSQPRLVSITQATELGTLYSIREIETIAAYVHQNNMYLHMDGARIANAAASLGCSFKEMTVDAGVDVLSFGGTKNGLMFGEAVLFFHQNTQAVKYIRKQSAQLHSKMRYTAAQFEALLSNELWYKNASHANEMARKLAAKLGEIPEIRITQKVESNGVFAIVPEEIIEALQQEFFFYMWDPDKSEVRWMTSFDTQEEDIDTFVGLIKEKIAVLA
ncbi:threonine aldolase family protein [Saccharicrinis fermentans]|uniref:Low specificity L-threonine aldolase n=1 Tax=Saccharicrinis fermentans DSM 9555 = JCM 21142 TaxID=869213 RepID=W7Y686_9BACT|nr:low specificity L-threonine aldolase [Saccharicrinis fermentans]GAF03682.1 low specificity L-threonine aldolase [Saccharicrinis fermentans DSM 9555 = JCM 21142]